MIKAKAAQQCMHPTSGSLRVFEHFSGFEFSPFRRRVSARPAAGNASRWLASLKVCNQFL